MGTSLLTMCCWIEWEPKTSHGICVEFLERLPFQIVLTSIQCTLHITLSLSVYIYILYAYYWHPQRGFRNLPLTDFDGFTILLKVILNHEIW